MQQTRLVAVISPDLMNPVFPAIIRGIEDRLQASGYVVLLVNTDNDPEREREAFDAMRQRQVDGIIAATAVQGNTAIPELLEDGVAIVLVNRSLPRSKVPAVVPDDRDGMRQSVDYVIRLGHERIAHLAGPRPVPNSAERRRGFIAAMKRAGQSTDAPIAEASRYAIEDRRVRRQHAARSTATADRAILAANDLLAIGAYRAAAARGLEVPRDVSIVGFNDMPFVDQFRPPLTTVRIPHRELGDGPPTCCLRRSIPPAPAVIRPKARCDSRSSWSNGNSASSPPRKSWALRAGRPRLRHAGQTSPRQAASAAREGAGRATSSPRRRLS